MADVDADKLDEYFENGDEIGMSEDLSLRDAEVVGSNPAVPTTKVLVRGLQSGLRPAPWSLHRTFIEHPVLESVADTHNRPQVSVAARAAGASIRARLAHVDHSE
jgi:hypothetical protein